MDEGKSAQTDCRLCEVQSDDRRCRMKPPRSASLAHSNLRVGKAAQNGAFRYGSLRRKQVVCLRSTLAPYLQQFWPVANVRKLATVEPGCLRLVFSGSFPKFDCHAHISHETRVSGADPREFDRFTIGTHCRTTAVACFYSLALTAPYRSSVFFTGKACSGVAARAPYGTG